MEQKTEIRTVEMVRRIRDHQAAQLRGKSDEEIIAYFSETGRPPRRRTSRKARAANKAVKRSVGAGKISEKATKQQRAARR